MFLGASRRFIAVFVLPAEVVVAVVVVHPTKHAKHVKGAFRGVRTRIDPELELSLKCSQDSGPFVLG